MKSQVLWTIFLSVLMSVHCIADDHTCTHSSSDLLDRLHLIDYSYKEKISSALLEKLEKKTCLEILSSSKGMKGMKDRKRRNGKSKKFGQYFEEGDERDDLHLAQLIQDFLKKKATLRESEMKGEILPKMLAFGEDHQAELGNKKRGKILTLIALASCLEGRPVTLMSEALNPEKIAQLSSSLENKRNYLKNYLFMDLVDQLPDSFLDKLRLETWEELGSSQAKLELKKLAEKVQKELAEVVGKESFIDQHDQRKGNEKLIEEYHKAVSNLQILERKLLAFVQIHARTRDEALVKNALKELENNQDQTLIVIAGENHLSYQNRYIHQLLKKEGVSIVMLDSRSEMGERLTKRQDLWSILAEAEDHLYLLRNQIRSIDRGVYLPSFPESLSYKMR